MNTIVSVNSQNELYPKSNDIARLKRAAHDLQSVLFNEVLKAARQTIPENEDFALGMGGEIFYSMLDEQVAQVMSEQMSSELTEAIYRQLAVGLEQDAND